MNRYCGPFALGYVTGLGPDGAARRLRELTGRRCIHGVPAWQMNLALKADLCVTEQAHYPVRGPTLAKWLRGRRGLYVVNVTGHYIVVDGGRIYDNGHRDGLPRAEWPRRRVRVKGYWRLERA